MTITQTITALPPAPDPATDTPAAFSTKAAAMVLAQAAEVAELNTWATQANSLATTVNSDATSASTSATTATNQAGNASTSATAAAASASTALNAPGTSAVSSTSLTVGSGSKSLTIQAGKSIPIGGKILIARTSDPANTWMYGAATAYDSGTGALSVSVSRFLGNSTATDWSVSVTGPEGVSDNEAVSVINGSFAVWQRGTTFPVTSSALVRTADMFTAAAGSATTATVSRQSPVQTGSDYAIRLQRDVGATSVAPLYLMYVVPARRVKQMVGKQVVISFYPRALPNFSGGTLGLFIGAGTVADQGAASFFNGTWAGPSTITSQAIAIAATPSPYTFAFTVPANAAELGIQWYFTPSGTAGANDGFELELVHIGETSAFPQTDFLSIYESCLHYLEVIDSSRSNYTVFSSGGFSTSTNAWFPLAFENKRTVPTITPSGYADFQVQSSGGNDVLSAISADSATQTSCRILGAIATPRTAGIQGMLVSNNTGLAKFVISAEL